MDHIKFPSINQFRQIVKNIRSSADYHGVKTPTITFECSVKIHGSNAAFVCPIGGTIDDMVFQSRERILSIESDNAGFAFWATANREYLFKIITNIQNRLISNASSETTKTGHIQVYGEWFGGNIHKGVGVNDLPKMLSVFGVRVSENAESNDWESREVIEECIGTQFHIIGLYTKFDFPVWYVDVDFNRPELSQNTLVDLCAAVEHDCPVARKFKPEAEVGTLIGEGIVAIPLQSDSIGFDVRQHFCKIKGEKHASSHVKTTAKLDPELMTSRQEFVDKALTENRLQQGVDKMVELGHPITMATTGEYLRWIMGDVFREEADTMAVSLIEPKDVNGLIASVAKKFWIAAVDAN